MFEFIAQEKMQGTRFFTIAGFHRYEDATEFFTETARWMDSRDELRLVRMSDSAILHHSRGGIVQEVSA